MNVKLLPLSIFLIIALNIGGVFAADDCRDFVAVDTDYKYYESPHIIFENSAVLYTWNNKRSHTSSGEVIKGQWLRANNVRTDIADGLVLRLTNGQPLRVKEVKVFLDDVYWFHGYKNEERINSHKGNIIYGNGAETFDSEYNMPNQALGSMGLFQKAGAFSRIEVQNRDEKAPQTVYLDQAKPVSVVAVDGINFSDNGGSFDLYLCVVE